MRQFQQFQLLIICLAFFGACHSATEISQSPNLPGTIQDMYPLAIGNHWLYDVTDFKINGSVDHTDTVDQLVKDTFVFNGHKAFLYQENSDSTHLEGIYYPNSYEVDGAAFLCNPQHSDFILSYPMPFGGTHVVLDTLVGNEPLRNEFILKDTGVTVRVDAGTFKCVQFDYVIFTVLDNFHPMDSIFIESIFVAPGIGIVKKEQFTRRNGIRVLDYIWTLRKYHINGK